MNILQTKAEPNDENKGTIMEDFWSELRSTELSKRTFDLFQFCKEQDYSTGQAIRAMMIVSESLYRYSNDYDLPDDEKQKAMVEELTQVILPLVKKDGPKVISILCMFLASLIDKNVDIKQTK